MFSDPGHPIQKAAVVAADAEQVICQKLNQCMSNISMMPMTA